MDVKKIYIEGKMHYVLIGDDVYVRIKDACELLNELSKEKGENEK